VSPRLRAAGLVVAVACASNLGVAWAIPRVVMAIATAKGEAAIGTNRFLHRPLPSAEVRDVVRPCPDFAYSTCFLDLGAAPVHVHVPLTAPYTSVALYSSLTDNFFVRNDRDTRGDPLDVVVVAPGAPRPAEVPPGAVVVVSPSVRAMALVRRVVESPGDLARIDAIRASSACSPLP
jgi:uncharacterized membrane protein